MKVMLETIVQVNKWFFNSLFSVLYHCLSCILLFFLYSVLDCD